MKVSTAIWKLKKAYRKWPPEDNWDEFWQEAKEILKEFKNDQE